MTKRDLYDEVADASVQNTSDHWPTLTVFNYQIDAGALRAELQQLGWQNVVPLEPRLPFLAKRARV